MLRKKILVYSDGHGKVYKFKKVYNDSNFGCLFCKMCRGVKCDKTLRNPIKIKTTVYFTIRSLCREINGRIHKKYIVV
jgi:hypothetical protein